MLRDIGTLVRKELGEWIGAAGKRSRMTVLVFGAIFGVVMPLQWGAGWIASPVSLISWAWLPFLLVSSTIADSIAGERERHTLESLLATRLTEGTILFGKLTASLVYGVGQLWFAAILAAVTVNVAFWSGEVVFYPHAMLAGLIVFPLLIAGFAAGIGVLVSIRAKTARQAQQSMTAVMLVMAAPVLLVGFFPESVRSWLEAAATSVNPSLVPFSVAGVLAGLDLALVAVSRKRFTRYRLVG